MSPNRIIAIGLSKDGAIAIERELHDLRPAASITTSLQKTVQEAAISAYQIGVADNAWGSTAIVSWDGCFGDQMTLLPYCWANKTPMFYVEEDESLSAKLLDALKSGNFSSVLLLGGESTFSNTLINELARHHVDARRICANNPSRKPMQQSMKSLYFPYMQMLVQMIKRLSFRRLGIRTTRLLRAASQFKTKLQFS